MDSQPIAPFPLIGYTRACAFSLATALLWLGHECHDGCGALVRQPTSGVWFIRLSGTQSSMRSRTLVVVDLGDCSWSALQIRNDLREVNRCVAADRILVRERRDEVTEPLELSHPSARPHHRHTRAESSKRPWSSSSCL